jgi:hypothetical protein
MNTLSFVLCPFLLFSNLYFLIRFKGWGQLTAGEDYYVNKAENMTKIDFWFKVESNKTEIKISTLKII